MHGAGAGGHRSRVRGFTMNRQSVGARAVRLRRWQGRREGHEGCQEEGTCRSCMARLVEDMRELVRRGIVVVRLNDDGEPAYYPAEAESEGQGAEVA